MARRSCCKRSPELWDRPNLPQRDRPTFHPIFGSHPNVEPHAKDGVLLDAAWTRGALSKLERIGWGCALPQFLVEETLLDEMEPVCWSADNQRRNV